MKKALFLLPVADQTSARHFTHISLWKRVGNSALIATFTRGDDVYLDSVDQTLGKIGHGKYMSRLFTYLAAIKKLVKMIGGVDVAFAYTLDNFYLLWFSSLMLNPRVKLVFFVLDIREAFIGKSIKNRIMLFFMRLAFMRSNIVVVSSSGFIDGFADEWLGYKPAKWLEIENKTLLDVKRSSWSGGSPSAKIQAGVLVIGYFGLIRCVRSLEILNSLTLEYPDRFRVIISGIYHNIDSMLEVISENPQIELKGAYKNPDDLPDLYASCDMVWACYPYSAKKHGNHEWAKTNRFYEACYFKKPLIVANDTSDAEAVVRYDIGLAIDLKSSAAIASLEGVTESMIGAWQQGLDGLPRECYEYTDEFARLTDII